MLSWTRQSASHAVSIAFAVSIAAAQPLSPVPCDEINKKARALVDSGKAEEARTFLNAAIQACAGAVSQSEKERLAAALMTLGSIEAVLHLS
jgi:hypothetical protein